MRIAAGFSACLGGRALDSCKRAKPRNSMMNTHNYVFAILAQRPGVIAVH